MWGMVEGGGSRSYKGRGRRLRRETLYETELLPVIPADQRRKPYSFGEEKILVSERGEEKPPFEHNPSLITTKNNKEPIPKEARRPRGVLSAVSTAWHISHHRYEAA
jgi:hypothetical protein